jgi:uncharacterized membrane protein YfcA
VDIAVALIILIICFVTAFVFSNTGMGGGLLYVPILVIIGSMTYSDARPISLAFAFATTGLSAYNHSRKGLVDFRIGGTAVLGTITGVVLGFLFVTNVDDRIPGIMFSVFIVAICIKMAYDLKKGDMDKKGERHTGMGTYALIALVTVASGFLAISLGIGGGILLVPLYIYIAGFETKRASGTSSFTAMFTTLASIILLFIGGTPIKLDPIISIFLVIGVALGAFIGSRWGIKTLKGKEVNAIIIGVMLLSAALMAWKYVLA